ncbi:hypothetical protein V3C99_006481 [Haemonchus contortus]
MCAVDFLDLISRSLSQCAPPHRADHKRLSCDECKEFVGRYDVWREPYHLSRCRSASLTMSSQVTAISPPPPLTMQPPLPSSGSSSASSSIGQLVGNGDVYMSPVAGGGTVTATTTSASSDGGGDSGEEMGPLSRDRCNTWPMRRPQLDVNAQTSPLIHEQIPEEDGELYDSAENLNGRLGANSAASTGLLHSPDGNNTFSPGSCNMSSPGINDQSGGGQTGGNDSMDGGVGGAGVSKKSTTRRNAWGNLSYADLITQAIMQSPEKRLTLSQVYEWMVQNVPYFRDKGDSNSSAGWKNSIRHNLSLHSRFMRIQNEGAGKSSWWVINPDAKPGRNPRRVRASTLDTTSKATLSKKLKGARKRIHDIRGGLHSGVSSLAGSQASVMSHDIYGDDDAMHASFDSMFRPRTQSNLSVPGSSTRVSPSMEHPFDDFDFPSWVNDAAAASTAAAAAAAANSNHTAPIPTDILDRTDQMRIDSCRAMMNGVKQEPKQIKTESPGVQPPSYLELSSVCNQSQLQNPLLRSQLASVKFQSSGLPLSYQTYSPWPGTHHGGHLLPPSSCAAVAQANSVAAAAALPSDLESLTLPDQPLMDFEVESLLRHELSQTSDHRLNFDNL